MDEKYRKPHPYSPAGGGGPGSFRLAGPLGANAHYEVGVSDTTELNILNTRIPAEVINGHGWNHSALSTNDLSLGQHAPLEHKLAISLTDPWKGPQPASKALWALVHANFPQTRFDGIYNPRNIAGTNTPSLHAEGSALDIGLNVHTRQEKVVGDGLFAIFVEMATQMELQEIIWNQHIWSTRNPLVHHYTGADDHTGHIHVGFTREGSQQTTFHRELLLKIGILRTGLEDMSRANSDVG